jgi:hypothetical protein
MFHWERRQAKLESRKRKMPKHGKGMMELYAQAVLKRANLSKDSLLTNDDFCDIMLLDEVEED